MPLYFFDIRDKNGLHRDEVGDELDSFEEARAQAQSLLPDMMREEMPGGDLHIVTCDVRDEADHVVYRGELTFRGTPL